MEVKIWIREPKTPTPETFRPGEVCAIRADGTHLTPEEVAAWIDSDTIPDRVPARHRVMMEHSRFDHIEARDGFDAKAQDELAAFLERPFVGYDKKGQELFTIPPARLQAYDAASNCGEQDDTIIHAHFSNDELHLQVPAAKMVKARFLKKWQAEYAGIVRAFVDTYGYDSNGWGMKDLTRTLIQRMQLTWEEASELTAPEYRFDRETRRPVVIRKRLTKIDVSAFISGETAAALADRNTVCPLKYHKIRAGEVIVPAEAAP